MPNEPTSSFVKRQQSKREIILGTMFPQISSQIHSFLRTLDVQISKMETLVNLGTQVSVAGAGRVQITNDDLEEHLGGELFGELQAIAVKGRTFLDELGFESTARVAPSVLLGKDGKHVAEVKPFRVENPGEPPLEGLQLTTIKGEDEE